MCTVSLKRNIASLRKHFMEFCEQQLANGPDFLPRKFAKRRHRYGFAHVGRSTASQTGARDGLELALAPNFQEALKGLKNLAREVHVVVHEQQ